VEIVGNPAHDLSSLGEDPRVIEKDLVSKYHGVGIPRADHIVVRAQPTPFIRDRQTGEPFPVTAPRHTDVYPVTIEHEILAVVLQHVWCLQTTDRLTVNRVRFHEYAHGGPVLTEQ